MTTKTDADNEIICKCFQVTEGVIRACIAEKNLRTVDAVTAACKAGGGCQSCHLLLQLFLDQHKEERGKAGKPVSAPKNGASHPGKKAWPSVLSKFR